MKKALFLVCLLSFMKVYADCNLDNVKYAITMKDQAHLTYLNIMNNFDGVYSVYTIGEISVEGSEVKPLFFDIPFNYGNFLAGDDNLGIDNALTNFCKTKPFIYDQESDLKLYRELGVRVSCQAVYPNDRPNSGTSDAQWDVGFPDRVLDHVEFVTYLKKYGTDETLDVIDSVGIPPNPNRLVSPYGTEPKTINITRSLPNLHAGDTVYLQVSVRRWGPTPYGQELNILKEPYSISTFKEYMPDGSLHRCQDQAFRDELHFRYYSEIFNYLDSITQNFNHMPVTPSYYFKDFDIIKLYYHKYYDAVTGVDGDTLYYVPKTNYSIGKESQSDIQTQKINVYPNPANSTVTISGLDASNINEMKFYDISGNEVFSSLIENPDMKVPINNFATGIYLIKFYDKSGLIVATEKFMKID